MTEQNAQGETVDVNDPAQQDDTMSITQEATNSGPDEATSDTVTEPEPEFGGEDPGTKGEDEQPSEVENAVEGDPTAENAPSEDDKPVWNVETHGPVREEIRDQYRVVGEK